ncbi:MAG: hypothetical protein KQH53_11725 [Desulfarculaceae bacterium]|nr:hypothetical protein [Desulfarculaceae bacterium]
MDKHQLSEMIGGWFVGDFDPTVVRSKDVEVAVKQYTRGDSEQRHMHKVAAEITVIAQGHVRMNGTDYKTGDIVLIHPGESTDFQAVEDTLTVVVKMPSVMGDKYLVD